MSNCSCPDEAWIREYSLYKYNNEDNSKLFLLK